MVWVGITMTETDVHVCQGGRVKEVYYWDNVLAPDITPLA